MEKKHQRHCLNVMGPDYDLPLLKTLQSGDKVLVEMNGFRLFSSNPIAAESSWNVVSVSDDAITIEHERLEEKVEIRFDQIVSKGEGPAVFRINGDVFQLPSIFVVLQMISHRSDIEGMRQAKYRWWINLEDYTDVFRDPILRRAVLEAWGKYFKESFTELGWGNKSFKRFALRANIKTDTIRAFVNGAWEMLDSLTVEQFCDIAREIEILPTRLSLSSEIQHDYNTSIPSNYSNHEVAD